MTPTAEPAPNSIRLDDLAATGWPAVNVPIGSDRPPHGGTVAPAERWPALRAAPADFARPGWLILDGDSSASAPDALLDNFVETARALRWFAESNGILVLLRWSRPTCTRATACDVIERINSPRVGWELGRELAEPERWATELDWRLAGVALPAGPPPAGLRGALRAIGFDGPLATGDVSPARLDALRTWIAEID